MDIDKAYSILNKLILFVGRHGAASWKEIVESTGFTEQEIKAALDLLGDYGAARKSSLLQGKGYSFDVKFVEPALQTLVSEGIVVAYPMGKETRYVYTG